MILIYTAIAVNLAAMGLAIVVLGMIIQERMNKRSGDKND